MTIIYKCCQKVNNKLLSSTTEIFKHNYKISYIGLFGLFGFIKPVHAKLFSLGLGTVVVKGETRKTFYAQYALDGLFTVKEHKIFWDLFHKLKRPPTSIEMMKNGIRPFLLPPGTHIVFDWKFIEEVDIDLEIFRKENKNANR